MSEELTGTDLTAVLPKGLGKSVDAHLMDQVNSCIEDPDIAEHFRSNLITYAGVLTAGQFKLQDYLNAVQYVTYKVMGLSHKDAFLATFPNKHARYNRDEVPNSKVVKYAGNYHAGKLVTLCFEVAMIPIYITNYGVLQEAIDVQADLMRSSSSDIVKQKAADSLMGHLQSPETKKYELEVKIVEDTALSELKRTMLQCATQESLAISTGTMTALDVAERVVIEQAQDDL
jgi:hypothetical protein